ncbi:MAG: FlgD immunoglobulin-like domain containing protein [Candidatus Latescibacterota bacterium]
MRRYLPLWSIFFLLYATADAQVGVFKLGGSGQAWSLSDSSEVFIDFNTFPGSMAPVYFDGQENILDKLSGWSPFKFPTNLGYEDGMIPRIWRAANGFYWFTAGTLTTEWVDGDSSSYSPPVARGIGSEWYTIDVGVPVPADVVGFYTPPSGFRADGSPLREDIFKAFEVSTAEEFDPVLSQESGDNDYHRLETLVADVPLNFDANVQLDFPKKYVRFIRLRRKPSIDDKTFASGQANVQKGTIGEFELKGAGVPRRVVYISQIIDLDRTVTFGNMHWHATPMRYVDGVPVEAPDARALLRIEVRSGRTVDPNIYHEFTDTGAERVVTRARFEKELKQPDQQSSGQVQEGKPGLRASIVYDQDNWTFWSFPIRESGQQAPLERGSFIQARVTLESESFFDFVRIDSMWVETSAPLALKVLGEVARSDEPEPERGVTEVVLGEMTNFVYDIHADFDAASQGGFDALRIRTGSRPLFKSLEMGDPLVEVEPVDIIEDADELVLLLPRKITRQNSDPVRVVFGAEIFVFANTFTGEVFDTESENLPQQIEAGNASQAIGTNNLRVLGGGENAGKVIENMVFGSSAVTPNGDGINDRLTIDYTLFRLPAPIPVELNIYDLQGRRVGQVDLGIQSAGPQHVEWGGRDSKGRVLAPGLYLLEIALRAELKTFRHLRPIGVAY